MGIGMMIETISIYPNTWESIGFAKEIRRNAEFKVKII